MALFGQTRGRSGQPPAKPPRARRSRGSGGGKPPRRGGRVAWLLKLLGGIALMAGAGYLVAALWLFPSPLLPSERMVPRVVGMTEREATREIDAAGFRARVVTASHVTMARGLITWQDPPAGMAVPKNAEIILTASSGPPLAVVPDVEGMDPDLADTLLASVGLRVATIDTASVKSHVSGIAQGTTPAAGDSTPAGSGVTLHVTP